MSGLLQLPGKVVRKLRSRSPSPSREKEAEVQVQVSYGKAEATGTSDFARSPEEFSAEEVRSAEELAQWLRRECKERDGVVNLWHKAHTNESMARLAEGLQIVFLGSPGDDRDDDDERPLKLKKLSFNHTESNFGGDGLAALAKVLSCLPRCRETLERLDICYNKKVTTLAPLADAGALEGMKELWVTGCSLSGDEGVLPPELCANLPALEVLDLSYNKGGAAVTLTAEALCALPAKCKVVLRDSRVQVARPSAEDGEMGLVTLPTAEGEEFEAYNASDAKTVAEICAFAGVQHMTLVKPARA